MIWFGLVLFTSIAVFVAFWLRLKYNRIADPMITQAVQMAMADASSAAVAEARSEFNVTLGYSLDTIQRVDEILGQLQQRRDMPELEVVGYATRLGGYVGETVKRRLNADWTSTTLPVDPMRVQMVLQDGSRLFPVRWCYDQIIDSNSESIRRRVDEIADDN